MAKYLLIDHENEEEETFDNLQELEEYLDENDDLDVDEVDVYEFTTKFRVTKKHELEEV